MRAYKVYDESGIEELGDVSKDQVSSLIEQAEASQASEKQFSIGFYRSENDFVEIRPVGKSEFIVWSDRIIKNTNSGFLGFFQKKKSHIDRIVSGRESAIEAASYYMDYSRAAFEQKYS